MTALAPPGTASERKTYWKVNDGAPPANTIGIDVEFLDAEGTVIGACILEQADKTEIDEAEYATLLAAWESYLQNPTP